MPGIAETIFGFEQGDSWQGYRRKSESEANDAALSECTQKGRNDLPPDWGNKKTSALLWLQATRLSQLTPNLRNVRPKRRKSTSVQMDKIPLVRVLLDLRPTRLCYREISSRQRLVGLKWSMNIWTTSIGAADETKRALSRKWTEPMPFTHAIHAHHGSIADSYAISGGARRIEQGTRIVNKILGGSLGGLNSVAIQQGGIGLLLTALIVSVPPMAAMFFQGTLGNFLTYSAFGGSSNSVGPNGQPPGSWSSHRVEGGGDAGFRPKAEFAQERQAGYGSRATGQVPASPQQDEVKQPYAR
jgi:hypothetical protein